MKLAAVLIALLASLSVLAVIIPQRAYLGAAFDDFATEAPVLARTITLLGLDRIYGGWPIIALAVALVVNLVACTLRRVLVRPGTTMEQDTASARLSAASQRLVGEGWRLLTLQDERLVAQKGGSGFIGSVVMHVGLVIVTAGAAVTVLTTFRGEMVVSEGQTVPDVRESYRSVTDEPVLGDAYTGTRISLESTDVRYVNGVLVSATARMRATEPDGDIISRDVKVNHPLDAGGKTYLLQDSGYAVRLVVASKGSVATPMVVALAEETPYGWTDHLQLPTPGGAPVGLEMLATPIPLATSQKMPAEKFSVTDPRLRLTVTRGSSTWTGVLAPGQSSGVVGGVTVTFEGLGLWDRLLVRGEPARWLTYVGFWITIIGALWRFAVPERRVLVRVGPDGALTASLRARPWSGFQAERDTAVVEALEAPRPSEVSSEEGPES